MKRLILTTLLALCACPHLVAQERSDKKSFEITPAAPPVPALKYQLLFDNYVARRPGNAAIFYFRVMLLQNEEVNNKVDAILQAFAKGDAKALDQADPYINRQGILDELDLAARCSDCDWQDPLHEFGYKTLLPQLHFLRDLGWWLKLRGLREALTGKPDEALSTARLGYEMSRKTAASPTLISGLVAMHIVISMDDVLAAVMDSPQSPNLYWALRQFPSQRPILQSDTAMERLSAAFAMPSLKNVLDGQEISPSAWNETFKTIKDIIDLNHPATIPVKGSTAATQQGIRVDPVRDSSPEMLQQAQGQYTMKHRDLGSVDPAQAQVDSTQALGEFYFLNFTIQYDELYKLTGLPYPQLLPRAKEFESIRWPRLKSEQPANIFFKTDPAVFKVAQRFAYVDRQIAALATVQAISAYAAGHGNQFPAKLSDIIDTPAPENPETGLPFEYKIDGDHAVLADSTSEEPLEYTIKIRK